MKFLFAHIFGWAVGLLWIVVLVSCKSEEEPATQHTEIRDVRLGEQQCQDVEGQPISRLDADRNRMKNRSWRDVPTDALIPTYSVQAFVQMTDSINAALGLESIPLVGTRLGKFLNVVNDSTLSELHAHEQRIVAVEGWLGVVYAGGKESANCYSAEFHDWHLELFDHPLQHTPRIGDRTPIVAEITPRVESALYQQGVRLQHIAAFLRTKTVSGIVFTPTKRFNVLHTPAFVRVTGYLFWDFSHAGSGSSVGRTIISAGEGTYYKPWRASAWEVHPILKIEVLQAGNSNEIEN